MVGPGGTTMVELSSTFYLLRSWVIIAWRVSLKSGNAPMRSLENIRSFIYLNSSGRPLMRTMVMMFSMAIMPVPSGSKMAVKASF